MSLIDAECVYFCMQFHSLQVACCLKPNMLNASGFRMTPAPVALGTCSWSFSSDSILVLARQLRPACSVRNWSGRCREG